jgi:hypothetical protein
MNLYESPIYNDGYAAAFDHKLEYDNPYSEKFFYEDWKTWNIGWQDGNIDALANF